MVVYNSLSPKARKALINFLKFEIQMNKIDRNYFNYKVKKGYKFLSNPDDERVALFGLTTETFSNFSSLLLIQLQEKVLIQFGNYDEPFNVTFLDLLVYVFAKKKTPLGSIPVEDEVTFDLEKDKLFIEKKE